MNGELADDPMRRICSECEAHIHRTRCMWSNQHGEKRRFFCDNCGVWEDRTLIYDPPRFEAKVVAR